MARLVDGLGHGLEHGVPRLEVVLADVLAADEGSVDDVERVAEAAALALSADLAHDLGVDERAGGELELELLVVGLFPHVAGGHVLVDLGATQAEVEGPVGRVLRGVADQDEFPVVDRFQVFGKRARRQHLSRLG